jgi:hypothetical protein
MKEEKKKSPPRIIHIGKVTGKTSAKFTISLAKNAEQIIQNQNKALQAITENLIRRAQNQDKAIQAIQRKLQQWQNFPSVETLADSLKLIKGISVFPLDGWYLSNDAVEVLGGIYLIHVSENWQDTAIKNDFQSKTIAYVNKYLDTIKIKILNQASNRSTVIDEIFKLHNEKRYWAAIPLALAQIDGICNEHYGVGFFKNERVEKKKYIQKLTKTLEDKSFSSLLHKQMQFDDKNKLQLIQGNNTSFDQLNRHTIMHGESTEYGTEINSTKAILLLDFLRDLIESAIYDTTCE